jgi:hypothetical protein
MSGAVSLPGTGLISTVIELCYAFFNFMVTRQRTHLFTQGLKSVYGKKLIQQMAVLNRHKANVKLLVSIKKLARSAFLTDISLMQAIIWCI